MQQRFVVPSLEKVKFRIVLTLFAVSAIQPVTAMSLPSTSLNGFTNNKFSSEATEFVLPVLTNMLAIGKPMHEKRYENSLVEDAMLSESGMVAQLYDPVNRAMTGDQMDISIMHAIDYE